MPSSTTLVDPFWSAAAGALIGGVALQYNQRRLDRKARRQHYLRLRSALVDDVVHNLRVLDAIWKRAKEPFQTGIDPGQVRMILGDATARPIGLGAPEFIHLETWESARNHIPAMADDPKDTVRFSRAFQLFKDSLAFSSSQERDEPGSRGSGFHNLLLDAGPTGIRQPTIMTATGEQLYGIPAAIFALSGGDGSKLQHAIDVVLEYGDNDAVEFALELPRTPWFEGAWTTVPGTDIWIPSKYLPKDSEPAQE